MMKIWLNLLTRPQPRGFTLLELLIASVLSFFVISATGFAILIMTRQSLVTNVSSDLSFNTNRASDFITTEAQEAKDISVTELPLPSDCPALVVDEEEFVMGLVTDTPTISNATAQTIIYYSKTPPGNPWRGPSSIYRCGPPLGNDGQLTSGTNQPSILVDSISSTAPSSNICPSGTTRFPTNPTTGFYVCRTDSNPKLIEIHITSTSSDWADSGVTRSGDAASSGTYNVVTKVFSRSATPPP